MKTCDLQPTILAAERLGFHILAVGEILRRKIQEHGSQPDTAPGLVEAMERVSSDFDFVLDTVNLLYDVRHPYYPVSASSQVKVADAIRERCRRLDELERFYRT